MKNPTDGDFFSDILSEILFFYIGYPKIFDDLKHILLNFSSKNQLFSQRIFGVIRFYRIDSNIIFSDLRFLERIEL